MGKRKRDSCEICKKAGRNPTGHIDVCCAFPGGPYAGRLDAARKARQEQVKSEKDRLKDQHAFNAVVGNEQLLSKTSTIDEINRQLKIRELDISSDRSKIEKLEAGVEKLETEPAKVNKFLAAVAAKSAVAKGSKGKGKGTVSVVAKGSKGKGKGMYPSSYSHEYDSWDY